MLKHVTAILLSLTIVIGGRDMPNWTSLIVNTQPWTYNISPEAHDNAEIIWNFFRSQGLTEEATAGILGNLTQESYVNPGQIGLGYPIADTYSPKGLMMWTTHGAIDQLYSYTANLGRPWNDGDAQIRLIMDNPNNSIFWPRNGYYYTWEQYQQLQDIDEATHAFCWEAEAPGDPQMNKRETAAHYWYGEFHGSTPGQTLPIWMMGRENLRLNIIHC